MSDPQLASISRRAEHLIQLEMPLGRKLVGEIKRGKCNLQNRLVNPVQADCPKRHLAIKVVASHRNRYRLSSRFCAELRTGLKGALFNR